ncbi:bifunctional UDP-sugar hydrolase/5'-nucleotidase [Psychrobacter arenosus]|uniref:bifunctional metallophosphatase/5'-nucleotidase n=1 Tax=Psychrobacter arenosus TaxID=256326 RepID=UPI001919A8E6|nr:5'-nucleotidase C-terminal domain-containing protein [Psychrobacter arenosus]
MMLDKFSQNKNTSRSYSPYFKSHPYAFNHKKLALSALAIAMLSTFTACNDDKDHQESAGFTPIELSIAHINDSHSHLEPEKELDFVIDNTLYRSAYGGFPRIKTVFDELESQYGNGNFLKLHAGDALTGTSYFSFYKGDADADMMSAVCFDGFALGNHEFDEGDAGLKHFLDRLNSGSCQTPVLGANVKPKVGTPLAPNKVDDYIKPYTIKTTKEGVKVGIIGLDIASKTKNSSRPLATTEFLDETTTAQNYINELNNQGIEHIVLLTHYTYENDQRLAAALTDVDVIIGGDSHTLLGDFGRYSKDYKGASEATQSTFGSQGAYPTVVNNKDGNPVCIGQAWEYTKAVGLMNISFDAKGNVADCAGSQIIPVAETFSRFDAISKDFVPLNSADNQALLNTLNAQKSDLLQKDLILPFTENFEVAKILQGYTDQLSDNLAKEIGLATESLCLVRVPGTTRSADIAGCEDTAASARGSDIAQVVAEGFLDGALRADFALQNSGGVRETIQAGTITYDDAYTVLPFSNTLVNLDITGQQVLTTLEDAIANYLDNNGSSGSHPYAAGLLWDLDLSQAKGNRVRNLEVRDRKTNTWSPIDLTKTYVMVTNDYIAEGRDGYTTLGPIFTDKTKVEDTKLLYTQSFIDYIEKLGTVSRPARSDYSHKTVITPDGKLLLP